MVLAAANWKGSLLFGSFSYWKNGNFLLSLSNTAHSACHIFCNGRSSKHSLNIQFLADPWKPPTEITPLLALQLFFQSHPIPQSPILTQYPGSLLSTFIIALALYLFIGRWPRLGLAFADLSWVFLWNGASSLLQVHSQGCPAYWNAIIWQRLLGQALVLWFRVDCRWPGWRLLY